MDAESFDFKYCPECGGSVKSCWTFVASGKYRKCTNCGKEWHVCFENPEDFDEPEETEDPPTE